METKHTHDNDNEELSFITLAAATANAVRYLVKENPPSEGEYQGGNGKPGKASENNPTEHSDYIDQRLRDFAAFERRARGKKKRRV